MGNSPSLPSEDEQQPPLGRLTDIQTETLSEDSIMDTRNRHRNHNRNHRTRMPPDDPRPPSRRRRSPPPVSTYSEDEAYTHDVLPTQPNRGKGPEPSSDQLSSWHAQLRAKEMEVHEFSVRVDQQQEDIRIREAEVNQLAQEMKAKEDHLKERENEQRLLEAWAKQFEKKLTHQQHLFDERMAGSAGETAIQAVARFREELGEKDNEIGWLKANAAKKDKEINTLKESEVVKDRTLERTGESETGSMSMVGDSRKALDVSKGALRDVIEKEAMDMAGIIRWEEQLDRVRRGGRRTTGRLRE